MTRRQADEFTDVVAALAERLNEFVPARLPGIVGLGTRDEDEKELGKGIFQERREVLHALDL